MSPTDFSQHPLIRRLAVVDYARPTLDRDRAAAALAEHFTQLGVAPLPVRWVVDAEAGYAHVMRAARSAAWSAAESAAWSAARSAAWSAAESAAESAARSAARSAAASAAEGAAYQRMADKLIELLVAA